MVEASGAEVPTPRWSAAVGQLAGPTVERTRDGGGPYLVTCNDSITYDAIGWGVFNELDRAGVEVGMAPFYSAIVGSHRVLPEGREPRVHVAVGPEVEQWRERPGVEEVASATGLTPDGERARRAARDDLVDRLRRAGLTTLAPRVDADPWSLRGEPEVARSAPLAAALERLLEYGPDSAVFLVD